MAERRVRMAGYGLALGLFLADQLAKWIVTVPLQLRDRGVIELLPMFDLRWVENYGISMGFLVADGALGRWLLVALTAAIAAMVGWWLWRERRLPDALALGAVLGGAMGNILDRVRLGHVVDYADLHFGAWRPFLVFNVGDAAISIGVAVLVLRAIFVREASAPSEDVHA